ncbi:MAG: D-glycero-beta-D-manno-heptose 1,7-bisphosphate 7-phosphatase [Halofilum sp. (in: g-proteobacteria)]
MTPLVILDRDGVINAESDAFIKSVAEWHPLPGSLEAIARLNRAGVRTALASNQSGVARGLLSEADLRAIHAHIEAALANLGGRLDPAGYCTAGPESGDPRRKPAPGMLLEIAEELGVSLAGVPYVGDSWRDVQAARAAGATPVLVRTGHGARTEAEHDLTGVSVHDDLAAFADAWLSQSAEVS